MQKIIDLSDAAIERIKYMMNSAHPDSIALRISLEKGGCSGMKYKMEYAIEQLQSDEVIRHESVLLFIDRGALLFLIGTKMDYQDSDFSSGFIFSNPNQVGACGCGESVMLNAAPLLETI